ncbi:MAG: membrane protein insertase YidC, partial [Pseudomonadota bacterium]|nr:membrane protein insertase YidC [Pseudomonadota bacterium]
EAQQTQTASTDQRPQADVTAAQGTGDQVVQDTGSRIQIDAPQLSGSFSTMGGRIDDVILKGYFETQDDDADLIHLFKRFDSESPYFAEFGWVASGNNSVTLPDEKTVWQADRQTLTPDAPVTLTYNNGDGLTFIRTIEINEDYLLTITDSVASGLTEPVTLSPYSLLRRTDT